MAGTGSITIGGAPIERIDPAVLRKQVALVTQEHHVFVGTLADNLRLGACEAGPGELEHALEVVGALGWARALPAGLDTRVGAGGEGLSAAQAQQVALARLVLVDPAVVILDEATAAFDPSAARSMERTLDAALAGRTVIAIAHRLHHGAHLDRIAVVEGGRITEAGTHAELLDAGGTYADLWARWQRHRVSVGGPASPPDRAELAKSMHPDLPEG